METKQQAARMQVNDNSKDCGTNLRAAAKYGRTDDNG
jgi:hypothetical protein